MWPFSTETFSGGSAIKVKCFWISSEVLDSLLRYEFYQYFSFGSFQDIVSLRSLIPFIIFPVQVVLIAGTRQK